MVIHSLTISSRNQTTTDDIVTNLVDGLMENDQLELCSILFWLVIGVFLKDGLTYTYTLGKD